MLIGFEIGQALPLRIDRRHHLHSPCVPSRTNRLPERSNARSGSRMSDLLSYSLCVHLHQRAMSSPLSAPNILLPRVGFNGFNDKVLFFLSFLIDVSGYGISILRQRVFPIRKDRDDFNQYFLCDKRPAERLNLTTQSISAHRVSSTALYRRDAPNRMAFFVFRRNFKSDSGTGTFLYNP